MRKILVIHSHTQIHYLSTVHIYCSLFRSWRDMLETIHKQILVHKRSH